MIALYIVSITFMRRELNVRNISPLIRRALAATVTHCCDARPSSDIATPKSRVNSVLVNALPFNVYVICEFRMPKYITLHFFTLSCIRFSSHQTFRLNFLLNFKLSCSFKTAGPFNSLLYVIYNFVSSANYLILTS